MLNNKEIKNRVFVFSPFGCPLRDFDAIKLRNYFTLNNYKIVESYIDADYYLYISCSATMPIIVSQINTIKELQNSSCELIVMGCMPGSYQEELKADFKGKTVSTKNIEDIDKIFPDFRIKFHEVPEAHVYDFGNFVFIDFKEDETFGKLLLKYGFSKTFYRLWQRSKDFKEFKEANNDALFSDLCFLKICSGCTNNCSYCNIKEAVGKLKSKSIDSLIVEYNGLLNKGYRLFHFIAEDICSYGLEKNSSLYELLKALSVVDRTYKVKWSLEGVNPGWLVKNKNELTSLIVSKKIWEITLSVEHGSDKIIKLMNRNYKISEVEQTLKYFRKLNPGLKINAMLIVGFPAETDDDYNKTLKLLKNMRFDCVTMSAYSEFEKRASSKIFPKVSEDVVKERLMRANVLLKSLKTPVIRGN